MAVLTATQGTQIATSSSDKKHGIFTYYFLKAIRDGKGNLAEIFAYLQPLVEDEARRLNIEQRPAAKPEIGTLKQRFVLK
jgi:hypothetical protein